jgi:hypothetical protein
VGARHPFPDPAGQPTTRLEYSFRQLYTAQYNGVHELRVEALNIGDQGTPFTSDILACPRTAIELEAGLHYSSTWRAVNWTSESWISILTQQLSVCNSDLFSTFCLAFRMKFDILLCVSVAGGRLGACRHSMV